LLVLTKAFFVDNEIYMAFLLNSQALGVSGKNEQSSQPPLRGAPEARGPMQLHRLHRLKAGPSRNNIKTRRNSIHWPTFSDIMTELT